MGTYTRIFSAAMTSIMCADDLISVNCGFMSGFYGGQMQITLTDWPEVTLSNQSKHKLILIRVRFL